MSHPTHSVRMDGDQAWHTGPVPEAAHLGSVKVRTGGYSLRPGRLQRPVDQVKFLDRRLKSDGAVRGGRAYVRAADLLGSPVAPGGLPSGVVPGACS